MNILESIMNRRRADIEAAKKKIPLAMLKELANERSHHSLIKKLSQGVGTRIVAEVKKASPSAGILVKDYRPAEIALVYQKAGAAGISVLTEPHYFQGSEEHLRAVRKAVNLPVLCKDFLCDPYQIYAAAAWGADVVLLIVTALKKRTLQNLYEEAIKCGLEVLAEVHTQDELKTALDLKKAIIGVNNRDLKTLKTNLSVAVRLAGEIPEDRLSIAESGIKTRSDIEMLKNDGYNGFLIGETLLAKSDVEAKLRNLLS